jgi:hypothetical protein
LPSFTPLLHGNGWVVVLLLLVVVEEAGWVVVVLLLLLVVVVDGADVVTVVRDVVVTVMRVVTIDGHRQLSLHTPPPAQPLLPGGSQPSPTDTMPSPH